VGFQIAELLERHDRSRFEVIGISAGTDDGSDIRARLLRAFDRFQIWRQKRCRHCSDNAGAGGRRRGDLSGPPMANGWGPLPCGPRRSMRLGWDSRQPPVRISMDYIIADDVVTPPEHQPFYSEKIVTLPDSFLFLWNTGKVKGSASSFARRRRASLKHRLCLSVASTANWKITSAIIDIWLRLLQHDSGQ
jgi:predicted O-linked N-acetylglucosamine transferase (SPINDLY family)